MSKTAGQILAEATKTYAERNAVYGENHVRAAKMLDAMFPDGLLIKGPEAFDRMHILFLILVKLSRYAVAVERGESHQDSLHDNIVYHAILEQIDAGCGFFDEDIKEPRGTVVRLGELIPRRKDVSV